MLVIKNVNNLDLDNTITCGQIFRFILEDDGSYTVIIKDRVINLKEDNDYLEKRFKEEEWHYNHIDEDRDAWKHKCQELEKENEQLKAQLYCDSEEGVCSICKHHYVEKTNMFYISKCEKGHEKCSKESVRHCEDFKLKELQE